MAIWFYRGLRKGIATTRYPKTIDPWTRDLPTPPAFHSLRLTGAIADRLTRACPSGAITREGPELVVDLGRCTCCGRCLEIAGDAAAPSGAFLLATEERSALIKRVPIGGDQEARP
jgi:hypothetical protein